MAGSARPGVRGKRVAAPTRVRKTAQAALLAVLFSPAGALARAEPAGRALNGLPGRDDVPLAFVELRVAMHVDVDGAPAAYGPPGSKTLDYLRNAHIGGRMSGPIVGYLTRSDHKSPELQGRRDPKPGYYISTTGFYDHAIDDERDMRRYLDATRVNYVVQGDFARAHRVRLGDLAAVHSLRTHRTVFAIVGDSGNASGAEGSLALVQALGYRIHDGKNHSVDHHEITIRYFPHSNPKHVFLNTQRKIDAAARALALDAKF